MDSAAWVAVVSAAIALGVGIASWFQLSAMKEQTELQRQAQRDTATPYVWVDFRMDPTHSWLVQLVVKNEGPTVAENVRITLDPPVNRVRNNGDFGDLTKLAALSTGLVSMPPGREMRWTIGSHAEVYEQNVLTKHRVSVTFDGPFGPVGPLEYDLDFNDFPGVSTMQVGSLHEVAKAIETAAKAVSGSRSH
ncbi:hypothetical protein [Georgenia sp. Marseille-Q6866]